jgi:FkbM family methyltransferase
MTIEEWIPRSLRPAIERLIQANFLCLSQAGQDFWVLGEVFNEKRNGFFVDVGAHDGVELSNTFLLEKRYGWGGICIEANPESFEKLEKNRRVTCLNACVDSEDRVVEFAKRGMLGGIVSAGTDIKEAEPHEVLRLPTQTLIDILRRNKAPNAIEYLSIDIEGAEERVLGSFDFAEYRFECMTIERPSKALREVLAARQYVLIKEIPGLDCFYVHETFVNQYQFNLFRFYKKKYLTKRWRWR